MRELAGLEFEEIGTALETSGAVARQTLYEARQSLRQMEEGREMSCDTVTKALSDGDGRVTRRRDVRAHLRSCARCQAFREEIKTRQHDLAALAPLPALAAAGMLQGLVGGSHGAATGGGLATTLGGGAAKTIGASAAAKGVATAAVVAAIGVTAADRSGVIDLGLPGDPAPKSAEPAPGSPGANPDSRETGGAKIGGSQGLDGSGKSKRGGAGDAAAAAGTGAAKTDAMAHPGLAEGAHHDNAAVPAHEHPQPHEEVSAEAQGPQGEHASGQDHEKQQPEAADGGQETAAVHKQPQGSTHKQPEESDHEQPQEGGAEHGSSHPAKPTPPAHPEAKGPPPTPAPPEEAPANPPAAASEPPASTPAQQAENPTGAPAGSPGTEHRSEKAP
jgi:hypothetical protein